MILEQFPDVWFWLGVWSNKKIQFGGLVFDLIEEESLIKHAISFLDHSIHNENFLRWLILLVGLA
jgi:hypothetical protein